jgi:hypothetical protein
MGLSRLANFDLEAAMVTFAEVPKPIDDRNAIARLARQVGNGGPEEAYDWIKQISQRQPTMRDAVLRSLSSNAPDFIEQKLSEETDTDLIASMVENLVQLKATAEPVAAMALLQRYGHPDSYTNAMRNLGYQWGTSNPQEMLDYVIDNPGAQGLVNSVNVATGSWYGKKPDEVLQWLDTVTRQAVRDQGFEGIALVMSTSDPVAALEFTESMSSLAKRENIRVQIIAGWIAKNTSRMDEILSEVELSDSGQARVRRYIDGL